MKLTILGSGTSQGIPVPGCDCHVCCSTDPRDKRMRSSLYVEGRNGEAVVIDTGPEFRLQALAAGIKKLDAVLLTHAHADHVHGLDDLRPLCHGGPMPVYGNSQTICEIMERFSYVFKKTQKGGGKPRVHPIEVSGRVNAGDLSFTPIPLKHGLLDILGWRIEEAGTQGAAVYLTDASGISETSIAIIGEPQILIINGLRTRAHETHFTFEEALNWAKKLRAQRTFLTHICHDYTHKQIEEYCRNFMEKNELAATAIPAWDSLVLKI